MRVGRGGTLPGSGSCLPEALQNNELSKVALNVPAEPHYLAATLARPLGRVVVSLYVAVDRGTAFPETKDRVAVLLDVVKRQGHGSQDGDGRRRGRWPRTSRTGGSRSTVVILRHRQGGSQAGIVAVARRDRQAAQGPTRSQGLYRRTYRQCRRVRPQHESLAAPREIGGRRLVQGYGIAPDRLKPVGAGLIAPVASNDDEAGRAKNRRVEIVKE